MADPKKTWMVEKPKHRYDTGAIIKYYQGAITKVSPNLAYPKTWVIVLGELNEITEELEKEDILRRTPAAGPGSVVVGVPKDQLTVDLERWRARLDHYMLITHSAKDEYDRQATLWEVTAPLLLGWVGGPTGTELSLPVGGYVEGFNTKAQHGADIATPYDIANRLGVWKDWQRQRVDLLASDMAQAAKDIADDLTKPGGIPWWGWLLGGGLVYTVVKAKK